MLLVEEEPTGSSLVSIVLLAAERCSASPQVRKHTGYIYHGTKNPVFRGVPPYFLYSYPFSFFLSFLSRSQSASYRAGGGGKYPAPAGSPYP